MISKLATLVILASLVKADLVWLDHQNDVANNLLKANFIRNESLFDSYVVGGSEAIPHSHPYQAALLVEANNVFFCSGSLISQTFVLTSADCVNGAKHIAVVLGAHDLKNLEPSQELISSTFYIRHHAWNETTNLNNIAVVKLSKPVSLKPEIQLVALPSMFDNDQTNATLTGWGKVSDSAQEMTYKLQEVQVQVMPNQFCEQIMNDITASHLCTSGKDKKGACDGDSGAPLVSNGIQIGIVSAINAKCQMNLPTVYTRVDQFLNWIKTNSDV